MSFGGARNQSSKRRSKSPLQATYKDKTGEKSPNPSGRQASSKSRGQIPRLDFSATSQSQQTLEANKKFLQDLKVKNQHDFYRQNSGQNSQPDQREQIGLPQPNQFLVKNKSQSNLGARKEFNPNMTLTTNGAQANPTNQIGQQLRQNHSLSNIHIGDIHNNANGNQASNQANYPSSLSASLRNITNNHANLNPVNRQPYIGNLHQPIGFNSNQTSLGQNNSNPADTNYFQSNYITPYKQMNSTQGFNTGSNTQGLPASYQNTNPKITSSAYSVGIGGKSETQHRNTAVTIDDQNFTQYSSNTYVFENQSRFEASNEPRKMSAPRSQMNPPNRQRNEDSLTKKEHLETDYGQDGTALAYGGKTPTRRVNIEEYRDLLRGSENQDHQRASRKNAQSKSPSISKSTSKTPLSKGIPLGQNGNQMKNSNADFPNTANVFSNYILENPQGNQNPQTYVKNSPSPLRKVTTYVPGTTTVVRIVGENDQRVSTPSVSLSAQQNQTFGQQAPAHFHAQDHQSFPTLPQQISQQKPSQYVPREHRIPQRNDMDQNSSNSGISSSLSPTNPSLMNKSGFSDISFIHTAPA